MFMGMAALLGLALAWFSAARTALAVAGCVYLLWLSWHIFKSGRPESRQASRPLGFWGAFAFQALNPKVWITSINASLIFVPASQGLAGGPVGGVMVLAGVFAIINLCCVSVWALAGDRLRIVLARPRALLIFNSAMAGLMALTALWILAEELIPLITRP
jgi:threonine/homoserine/homoserine lactone efflux protein